MREIVIVNQVRNNTNDILVGHEIFESDTGDMLVTIGVKDSSRIKETMTYFFGRYFSTQGSWRDEAIP